MRAVRILMAVSLLALAGCGRKVEDKVVMVEDNSPAMQAAFAKARATAPTFIAALEAKKPGAGGFAVKVMFKDGNQTEHMWLSRPTFHDGKFIGVLDNEPEFVHNVKMGQVISVAPGEITDWMYVENRKLVGGYTLRAIRDSKTPAERAQMDREIPFAIE
jgi:uncharacterized protein YegJ (DUF2314 family)